jgi:hypothetical protein
VNVTPSPRHPLDGTATVLTSIMDSYDTLKPICPQVGVEVDWVCLTDSVKIRDEAEIYTNEDAGRGVYVQGLKHPTGWQIIYYARGAYEHPNRAAKRPKIYPGMYTGSPASVWVDASFRVLSPRFVIDTITIAGESADGIAQFKHPWRDDYRDEADASLMLPKYADEQGLIRRQADAYDHAGMPRHWGLWATGVIARIHTRPVLEFGRMWGKQIDAYSYQDQISHPYTLWRHGLRPVDLPGDHFHNAWLAYEGSGRH